MLGLYEERYRGFTVKHFHEQLPKRHHYKLGYTATRLALQRAGLDGRRRGAPHRKKRPRRPMIGMMLHQDASRFGWLPGDDRQNSAVSPCRFRQARSARIRGTLRKLKIMQMLRR
jgi:hypothetical protein